MDPRSTTKERNRELADVVERTIESWFDNRNVPGLSVAVVDGHRTLFAGGFGDRRLDPAAPATAQTLYGIGSATKPVTATAVLTLVDDGSLSLDHPVSEYVPYFETVPGEPITVHELLSHTSGMPSDDSGTALVTAALSDADLGPTLDGWADFEDYVRDTVDRRRTDCERFLYYNTGYVILSQLVKAVSGRPFPEFVEDAVFGPLGMDRARFGTDIIEDESEDVMTPYVPGEDGYRTASLPDHPIFKGPGGLLASVEDLGAFIAAQVTGGPELDDDLRQQMHDPVVTAARRIDGAKEGYGYGWQTRPFGSDRLVEHSGNTGVSAGYVGFLRNRSLGVAVCSNAPPERSPADLATLILATLTDRDPVSVSPSRALDQKAEQLTGRYEAYGGLQTAAVRWTGSRLVVDHSTPFDKRTLRLQPDSLDPTEYEFSTVEDDGTRTTAEFFCGDDDVEMLIDRMLFCRQGDLDD